MSKKRLARTVIATVLATGSAAMASTYWAYRRDMRAIRARLAAGSQMVDTACGPIEYATWGAGEPVLISHATAGGYDQGLLMARMFVGDGYRSIAPSRFGHLRTPQMANNSAEAQADMFACLLDALGVDHAAILGMSSGGPVAMQFALRHPDRTTALVLLSTAAYAPPTPGTERNLPAPSWVYSTLFNSDFLFWAMVRGAGSTLAAAFGATPELQASAPAEENANLKAMIEAMLPIRMRSAGLANDAAMVDGLTSPYPLEHITAPTLVIQAKDDPAAVPAGAQYTAEHIPGAKRIWYETGGHVLLGHHAETQTQVREFLARANEATR